MIRELPLLPEFTYCYTCRRCGCHNVTFLPMRGGFAPDRLVVCSFCGWVYPRVPEWARRRGRRPSTVADWEIAEASGWDDEP